MNWYSSGGGKKQVMKKCPHGKQKRYCVDCGGKGLCLHGKNKYRCVECGGKKQVEKKCPHGKQRSYCVECGGKKQVRKKCPHGKQKGYCVDCGGKKYVPKKCPHGKNKYTCVDCAGKKTTPSQKKRKQPGGMEIARQINKKRRKVNAVPSTAAPVAATVVATPVIPNIEFETTTIDEFQIMAANKIIR